MSAQSRSLRDVVLKFYEDKMSLSMVVLERASESNIFITSHYLPASMTVSNVKFWWQKEFVK